MIGTATSGVYFLSDGSAVKIGCAGDVTQRVRGLRAGAAHGLELLGVVACSADKHRIEKQWHRRFADLRLGGEWFRLTDELREAIRAACARAVPRNPDGIPYARVVAHDPSTNALVVECPYCGDRHRHGALGVPRGGDITPALGHRARHCTTGAPSLGYVLVRAEP